MVEVKVDGDGVDVVGPLFPLKATAATYNLKDITTIFDKIKATDATAQNKSKKGRFLVATKKYKKGSLIFRESLFTHRVTSSMLNKICNHSLKSMNVESILDKGESGHYNLLKETRTNAAWFHTKSDLQEAWGKGHKEHVNGFVYLKRQDVPVFQNKEVMDSVYFGGQVFLALLRAKKMKDVLSLEQVSDLYCPFDQLGETVQEEHFTAAVLVTRYLKLNFDEYFEHKLIFLTRLMCALNCNSYDLAPLFSATLPMTFPSKGIAYTLGLYPGFASKINASERDFNAFYTFDLGRSNSISFFAAKDIEEGEEITTSYSCFDDTALEKAIQLEKYAVFHEQQSKAETVLEFNYRGAFVEVLFYKSSNLDMEDFDIRVNRTKSGSQLLQVCINQLSEELKVSDFKSERYIRNLLGIINAKEYVTDFPPYYFVNLDIEYSSLIAALKEQVPLMDFIQQCKTFLEHYESNKKVRKNIFPFYYFKKYDIFALLSTRGDFSATNDDSLRTLVESWSKELLENLSPVLESSGQTGILAKRLLETSLSQVSQI